MNRRLFTLGLMAASSSALTACAPLLVGGAVVGGTLAATDRRTVGMQVEDQRITLAGADTLRKTFGDRVNVNVHAYNRRVLLTGQVPDAATRANVERAIATVPNVAGIVNEIEVSGQISLTSRSNDVLLATRVKAALIEAKDLFANAYRVTAENGIVYMMGRVTEREGNRAAELASRISGVRKVVKVFETISEQELQRLMQQQSPGTDNKEQVRDGMH
jgi:osmotically-inducible protein OsmY